MAGSTFLELVAGEIGVPYVYGGDSPKGFDCSGLVQWAAGKMGVDLPRGATDQMHAMPHVTDPVAGDLVFFNTGDGWEAGHVGICANTGCSEMVDAPHSGALVRREAVDGFGQIVAYGRLPNGRGQLGVDDQGGGLGLSLPGVGDVGSALEDLDPIAAVESLIGSLPGELLKVFLGGHTVAELALRGVMIVGGALVLGAGAISLLMVVAHGGGEPERATRGVTRAGRQVAAVPRGGIRRANAATTPQRAPRARTRDGARRLNALQRAESTAGDTAATA